MRSLRIPLSLLTLVSTSVHATAPTPTQGDFTGVGLLQTPTARMEPEGTLSVNASRVTPYTRVGISGQPLDWLEATLRYTTTSTIAYGAADVTGTKSNLDKGFDFKARVFKESQWQPEVAVGLRDIGGTSLFSSEYIVANKRWYDLDFSLGLGWGYLGKQEDLSNPLGILYSGFKSRPKSTTAQGGTLGFSSFFRGPAAVFGGVQWQTPIQGLQLKLEYDGNNYRNDFGGSTVKQTSRFNYGLSYRLNNNMLLSAGWERGNTAMLGLTIQADLSPRQTPPRKISDPSPEAVRQNQDHPTTEAVDWKAVTERIEKTAGLEVERISQRQRELVVTGEAKRYFYTPSTLGRVARVVDNVAAPNIDWITLSEKKEGMPLVDTSVKRSTFRSTLQEETSLTSLQASVEHVEPALQRQATTIYEAPTAKPFNFEGSLGYKQSIGGPDAPILYQFTANLDASYRLNKNTWVDGLASLNLFNNYQHFVYTAPSNLPRVRTYIREYLVTSNITMPRLQLNHTKRLDNEIYALTYAGYLESMYAGIGGEVLYRPLHSDLALGFDVNWVKQRTFEQNFNFRNYDVVTGHITAYQQNFLMPEVLLKISAGRYLAGDVGLTIDIGRKFSNGVRMGVWATKTNVSAAQFGEGSFDKGFYIAIPFDLMTTRSTQEKANIILQPLTRDGGARLNRSQTLYDLTEGRNLEFFHQNFRRIQE